MRASAYTQRANVQNRVVVGRSSRKRRLLRRTSMQRFWTASSLCMAPAACSKCPMRLLSTSMTSRGNTSSPCRPTKERITATSSSALSASGRACSFLVM
eukprot:2275640-Pyramimonas_sp.AAC.1